MVQVDGVFVFVHRLSWILHKGPIPTGMFICHHCDNRPCVNPEHLFMGTKQDNSDDCKAKNRLARLKGELNGNSRLTNEDVLYIRSAYPKVTGVSLAKKFNVHPSMISLIVLRKEWTHI